MTTEKYQLIFGQTPITVSGDFPYDLPRLSARAVGQLVDACAPYVITERAMQALADLPEMATLWRRDIGRTYHTAAFEQRGQELCGLAWNRLRARVQQAFHRTDGVQPVWTPERSEAYFGDDPVRARAAMQDAVWTAYLHLRPPVTVDTLKALVEYVGVQHLLQMPTWWTRGKDAWEAQLGTNRSRLEQTAGRLRATLRTAGLQTIPTVTPTTHACPT